MIKKILTVRKAAMLKLECSSGDEWSKELATLVMLDRMLVLIAFWFVGSWFLLVVTIFQGSLEAFGGFVLSVGGCAIFSVPFLRWYIHKCEGYLGSEN